MVDKKEDTKLSIPGLSVKPETVAREKEGGWGWRMGMEDGDG